MCPKESAEGMKPGAEPLGTSTVLDGIVQAAAVELFRVHRVAVAPGSAFAAVRPVAWPDMASAIKFSSPELTGVLTLCMPSEVLEQLVTLPQSLKARDLIRELSNQLMGRIKNRLLQCKVTLTTSLPTTSHGEVIDQQSKSGRMRIYPFRALRGELFVVVDGQFVGGKITYSGNAGGSASEGDIIIF